MTTLSFPRGSQPKCVACSHPVSFHGGGQSPCRALGCHCETWVEPTLSVAEVADQLGRSQTYVKDHAEDLGGHKTSGRWEFPMDTVERAIEMHEDPAETAATPS